VDRVNAAYRSRRFHRNGRIGHLGIGVIAESAEACQRRVDAEGTARRRRRPQCRGAGPVGSRAELGGRIERFATR
jgi:hypothetical protein